MQAAIPASSPDRGKICARGWRRRGTRFRPRRAPGSGDRDRLSVARRKLVENAFDKLGHHDPAADGSYYLTDCLNSTGKFFPISTGAGRQGRLIAFRPGRSAFCTGGGACSRVRRREIPVSGREFATMTHGGIRLANQWHQMKRNLSASGRSRELTYPEAWRHLQSRSIK